jgi:hypothetical protein
MITTTLNRIRAHDPCREGWTKLLNGLGKNKTYRPGTDEPLLFSRIIQINGIQDALWCCRAEPQYAREWRLFSVWCARQIQHSMTDERSIKALDVAERYANGLATCDELAAASKAAWAAASEAAWAAARAFPWEAASYAAWAAARAAASKAAREAAREAAWETAWAAARAAQSEEFLRIVTETKARAA